MGNATGAPGKYTSLVSPGDTAESEINICLACQRDNQDTRRLSHIKQTIRTFVRATYATNASTIFRWTTWDIDTPNADIVATRDAPPESPLFPDAQNAFHVLVTVYCNFGEYRRDIEAVYRLLKPDGLVLLLGFEGPDWHTKFKSKYQIPLTFGTGGHVLPKSIDGYSLVPIRGVIGDEVPLHDSDDDTDNPAMYQQPEFTVLQKRQNE